MVAWRTTGHVTRRSFSCFLRVLKRVRTVSASTLRASETFPRMFFSLAMGHGGRAADASEEERLRAEDAVSLLEMPPTPRTGRH